VFAAGADDPNGYVLKYWVKGATDNPHLGRSIYKMQQAAEAAAVHTDAGHREALHGPLDHR